KAEGRGKKNGVEPLRKFQSHPERRRQQKIKPFFDREAPRFRKERHPERGQVAEKEPVTERFAEPDAVGAKGVFEENVDDEEKKKERQGPEPPADIENANRPVPAQRGAMPDQDAADQESAQDEKQFHPVKPAVPEKPERLAEVRVKHDES